MIVAGFGFRTEASLISLSNAFERAKRPGVTHLATLEDKATGPVFQEFADMLELPIVAVPNHGAVKEQLTQTVSTASLQTKGVASVSEATALVAAGAGAVLIQTRVISPDGMATCAIARGA